MPSLDLFLHDSYIGIVGANSRDRTQVSLEVDGDYQPAVLLSESFAAISGRAPAMAAVSNFLGGYVPEGYHRERMAAKRGIDKNDLFALLNEFGGSIAGAVTLRHPDESPGYVPSYEPLDDQLLAAKLRQALKDSDQGIPNDSRSTLPGYQPKVLVARIDGQWVYPHGRAHSTYILKPQIPSRSSRIFDEYYSHLLTRRIGLSGYSSQILDADGVLYLAIERFDRRVEGGEIRLVHQEDLAQAMGLDWRDADVKFQDPYEPNNPARATMRKIAACLGLIQDGGVGVEQWIRQVTYNMAIGNNDAHAKNTALMHLETGTRLSPIYDAVPNLFQDELINWDLALAVDGLFDHRRISVERLLAEIRAWRIVPERRAIDAITETLTELDLAVSDIKPPIGVSEGLVDQVQWNVRQLLAGTEIGQRKH